MYPLSTTNMMNQAIQIGPHLSPIPFKFNPLILETQPWISSEQYITVENTVHNNNTCTL